MDVLTTSARTVIGPHATVTSTWRHRSKRPTRRVRAGPLPAPSAGGSQDVSRARPCPGQPLTRRSTPPLSPIATRSTRSCPGRAQVRARGRDGRGRSPALPRLQPAVRLRRRASARPTSCSPSGAHDAAQPARARALRHERELHDRVHPRGARPPRVSLPAAVPRHRRAAPRRRAVPRSCRRDADRVLPHVQPPAPTRAADRDRVRPAAPGARRDRGAAPQPLPVRPGRGRAAARPRDAGGDPPAQGNPRPPRRAEDVQLHIATRSTRTSASPWRPLPAAAFARCPTRQAWRSPSALSRTCCAGLRQEITAPLILEEMVLAALDQRTCSPRPVPA